MNVPLDRTLRLPIPRPVEIPAEEATAVGMGHSLSAVFFDRPAGRRERMQAEQDGAPIPRPFIAAQFALRSGGARHVLFVPQGIDRVLSRPLMLRLDGFPAARIDPDWLQLPQGDLGALTAQLSAQGLDRLLRVMLTTGASLFAGPSQAGLADSVPPLLDICGIPALQPVARYPVAGRVLVTYAAPGLNGLRDPADAVALLNGRLARLKNLDCLAEGGRLHVLLPPGLSPVPILVFGQAPLRLADGASLPRLPVAAWIRAQGKAAGDWLAARLGGSAPLAQGRGLPDPKIAVRHLSALPTGLLHLLVLKDPARRVRAVLLERQGLQATLTPAHRADGTAVLAGFADLPGGADGTACRIRILDHAGHIRSLWDGRVAAYDGGIPQGFEDAWTGGTDALRPLAQARAAFRRPVPPAVTQHFGPSRKCALRIVTPVGTSADLIRARAALILAEGPGAPVEVICTMTDGPLAAAARHALVQTAAIYDIPHRLVLLPPGATQAEAVCAALSDARDAPALVLGPDILPEGTGWLAFWLRRLRRQAALAPALLASDGSIAGTREGDDPWRGLPAAHLPPLGRPADRPLAACLALAPAGIARLLDGDAPHSDPALWIAAVLGGIARGESRHPFRRYGPAAPEGAFAAALRQAGFALIEQDRR